MLFSSAYYKRTEGKAKNVLKNEGGRSGWEGGG